MPPKPPGGSSRSKTRPPRRPRAKRTRCRRQQGATADEGAPEATGAAQERAPDATAEPPVAKVRKHRDGTKEALLIDLLRRLEGATIAQIIASTGWQAHSVRGAFAGALKKKRGLTVISAKPQGGGRVYRLAD